MWKRIISAMAATALVIACSSESKLGEECDEVGQTEDVCESGSVCGKDSNGAVVCLKICVDQANCDTGKECNGVEGTNVKGCRTPTTSGGKK